MSRCPNGHDSDESDYCDVCGAALADGGSGRPCRVCGAARREGTRFCESCGTEREAPRWSVDIAPDRSYFDARGPAPPGLVFPAGTRGRRVLLVGARVRIGRSSASRDRPEIDLSGPPRDPGISRDHALLLARPGGSWPWTLVDTGSANGTYLNDLQVRLPADHEVPLAVGDRIHLGAWTTLVLRRDA